MGALNHVFFCVIGFEHGGMWISHCAHANVVVCVLVIVYKCGIFECVFAQAERSAYFLSLNIPEL